MCDTCNKLEALGPDAIELANEITQNVLDKVEVETRQFLDQVIMSMMRTLGVTVFRVPRSAADDTAAEMEAGNIVLDEDGSDPEEFVFTVKRIGDNPTNVNPLQALLDLLGIDPDADEFNR